MNELKSHEEVINKVESVLILGYGWVGQYMNKLFKNADIYDINGNIKISNKKYWDYAFICVPTDMNEDGSCDLSNIENTINDWKDYVKYFCIKSTVSVGTVDYLKDKYNIDVCFSPEYIGETIEHPVNNGLMNNFIILGGNKDITSKFTELFTLVTNSYTKIYQTTSKTAELCKLMENSWLATKVTFCNEFFEIAKKVDVDYNELKELWLLDDRINRSHTHVFRNIRGFGGKCLPKDLNNLCYTFKKEASLISFILDYNKEFKKEK